MTTEYSGCGEEVAGICEEEWLVAMRSTLPDICEEVCLHGGYEEEVCLMGVTICALWV